MRKVQTISRKPRFYVGGPSETTRQAPSIAECQAYLLGALHDGTFNRYNQRYRFAQLGTDWLLVLKHCLLLTGNTSWIYREGKNRGVYVLETKAKFLDIKYDPSELVSPEEKVSYLRGFFDAEGGIPRNSLARFYIQLVQKDKVKLEKLKHILTSLGIHSGRIHNPSFRVDPNYFRMFIPKKSQETFLITIGSWHPRKINTLQKRVMI